MTTEIEIGSVWVKDGVAYFVDDAYLDVSYLVVPNKQAARVDWFESSRCIFRPSDADKPKNTIKLRAAVGKYGKDCARFYIYGSSVQSDDEMITGLYGWGCDHIGWAEIDFPIQELPTVEGVVK